MSAQHTLGPWVTDGENIYAYGHDWLVASTCETDDPVDRESNARLIAAAPDLLDALTKLIPMFADWHAEFPEHVGHKEAPALQLAIAAISKAGSVA